MLTGKELLQTIEELKDIPKADLVRKCGYAVYRNNGDEILNFTGFYEAVLEARGIAIDNQSDCPIPTPSNVDVIEDGKITVMIPAELQRSPAGKYGIQLEEWDAYYPGSPIRVLSLGKDLKFALDHDYDPGEFDFIANSTDDFILIEADWLQRGDRYTIEVESGFDSWSFRLEPMPWNGLEESSEEDLRLLVLPTSSVQNLLSLCHPNQESLFDLERFESFEAHLAFSMSQGINRRATQEAANFFALFGYSPSDIPQLIKDNWLSQVETEDLPLIKIALEPLSSDQS